jgi:hypothetical protein
LFIRFTLQVPPAQSTVGVAEPEVVKQVNVVHGAAVPLAKQLSVVQHPTTVVCVAVPVYDAVHELAHE